MVHVWFKRIYTLDRKSEHKIAETFCCILWYCTPLSLLHPALLRFLISEKQSGDIFWWNSWILQAYGRQSYTPSCSIEREGISHSEGCCRCFNIASSINIENNSSALGILCICLFPFCVQVPNIPWFESEGISFDRVPAAKTYRAQKKIYFECCHLNIFVHIASFPRSTVGWPVRQLSTWFY